jgi:hypothetical protein
MRARLPGSASAAPVSAGCGSARERAVSHVVDVPGIATSPSPSQRPTATVTWNPRVPWARADTNAGWRTPNTILTENRATETKVLSFDGLDLLGPSPPTGRGRCFAGVGDVTDFKCV